MVTRSLYFSPQVTDVNDNAPEFLPTDKYSVTFSEKQEAGSIVAVLNTNDRDAAGDNSLVSIIIAPVLMVLFHLLVLHQFFKTMSYY